MTLTLLPVQRFLHEWEAIKTTLEPAVKASTQTHWDLFRNLMSGNYAAFRLSGNATGYVVCNAAYPKGKSAKTMWILFAAAKVSGAPKVRFAAMGEILAELENVASAAKCKRVRVEGRAAWRRLLVAAGFSEIDHIGNDVVFEKVI